MFAAKILKFVIEKHNSWKLLFSSFLRHRKVFFLKHERLTCEPSTFYTFYTFFLSEAFFYPLSVNQLA